MAWTGSKKGFTLVEVLVAMGIFSLMLLGLAAGATSVMKANQTALTNTLAANLAQDKLEELKALPPASITTAGSPENNLAVAGAAVRFNRSWTVNSGLPNCLAAGLKCIEVTVAWTDYTAHSLKASAAVKE